MPISDTSPPRDRIELASPAGPSRPQIDRSAPTLPLSETRPEPRPDRIASTASPAQKAAGSGSGVTTGTEGQARVSTRNASQQAALQAQWSASIQQRIARNQQYPRGRHGSGRVKVEMVILRTGQLSKVSLKASSGRDALDAAALRAVQRSAPFPPAPSGLTEDWYRVAQWMSFRR